MPELISSRLRLIVKVGVHGLDSLRDNWEQLFNRLEYATLCHDFRWVRTLTEKLFSDSLLFCAVYADDALVAVFYLWRGEKIRGSFRYIALEGPTNAEFIVLADALILPEYREASLFRFVLSELSKRTDTLWDVFSFSNCSERSLLRRMHGIDVLVEDTDNANAYVPCKNTQDLEALSGKQIKNIRRCERRASSDIGDVRIDCSSEETIFDFFNEFLALENSGWKGGAGSATSILASGARAVAFYHCLLEQYSGSGDLKIYMLRFNHQLAASAICIRVRSVVSIYKIAYNEALHSYSPGGMLLYHILKMMAEEPDIDEVNLMTCPHWSKRWHMPTAKVQQIRTYSHSYRATFFRMARFFRNLRHDVTTKSSFKKRDDIAG